MKNKKTLRIRAVIGQKHKAMVQLGSINWIADAGRGGIRRKRVEGDGISPIGSWPIRRLWIRLDKGPRPLCGLPIQIIKKTDGWCDDRQHTCYNRPIVQPFTKSHEALWRDDDLYDVIVELGYNDFPVKKGKGSAIFMHIARPDRGPTAGCIALPKEKLRLLLRHMTKGTHVQIAR
jgi:L,D-peptidoglycan transpeptidase YkuD (ErfK/YbiS/YcfS/YnhG family)